MFVLGQMEIAGDATNKILSEGGILGALVIIGALGLAAILKWLAKRFETSEAAWKETSNKGWTTIAEIESQHRQERQEWRQEANQREDKLLYSLNENTKVVQDNSKVVQELSDTVRTFLSKGG